MLSTICVALMTCATVHKHQQPRFKFEAPLISLHLPLRCLYRYYALAVQEAKRPASLALLKSACVTYAILCDPTPGGGVCPRGFL